jgi:glycosyltransferase involved in cell wall biosynthesis
MENKSVSIIMPAYNEDGTVESVIDNIKKIMDSSQYEYEIIVIDDGSNDNTPKVLANKSGIKIIKHERNKGYGASLKDGIKNAKYNIVTIIDADGTYPAEKLPELLNNMNENDMVVASRTGKDIRMPLLRKMVKSILNKLANYLSGTKIPDLNSGLRVIKKDVVFKFFNILPSGFSFTTTITLALLTNGYSVKYLPINYHHRKRKSKFHPIKDTMNMLTLVIRTILYFNPLKIFMPLGIGLILSGIFVFIWSALFLPKLLDVTTMLLITTGIQTLVIGLLADMIGKKTI